ncbi:DUF3054 domain-containing protein [Xylanimonas protaetiae]|uniref:DUF3054 domain-containing protein n=1 Tax=Xylanimonas protaetiae TaxID=2509457 RepID=A0A4P6F4D9_9MICO|nr:DUF3054 domain-containing protein [Xylanimonas protaetiae]QAY70424.1 DUF3054 domain-containing protein [Xylanimonas protaetiae]
MVVSTGRALVYDVVVVLVFLLVGSAAHDAAARGAGHELALGACFLAGLAAGWGVSRAWRSPARLWPTGVTVWLVTVAVGVLLRGLLVADAGFAPSFLAVATVFLGVTLLGWRALARVPARRG